MNLMQDAVDWVAGSLNMGIGLAILASALVILLLTLNRRSRVEDPVRLMRFIDVTRSLDWSERDAKPAQLDKLAAAIVDLLKAEVDYYYRTRSTRRLTAGTFRWGAFVLGGAGLIMPLLEAAVPDWQGLSKFGFVTLALAAACLAGNELFGGTRGHIRSVTTQYKLERLIAGLSLDYQEWRHDGGTSAGEDRVAEGFKLLREGAAEGYAILEDETKSWGEAQVAAEAAYGQGVGEPPKTA